MNNIFDEIINYEISNLGFKNPQYKKEYFSLYWSMFWDLFDKSFSKKFQFDKPYNFSNRTIYVLAKNKSNQEETLFILSLPEGHMPKNRGKVLGRLKFKSKKVKEYIKENKAIFYITFYAPLKMSVEHKDQILTNTDFSNSIFIISTLQEIWNCSRDYYGERYMAIVYDKIFKKQDWISMSVNYKDILTFMKMQKVDLKNNIIFNENGNWINKNQEGTKKLEKKNISYNLVKATFINDYIDQLIKKNDDFIQWINSRNNNEFYDYYDSKEDNVSFNDSEEQEQKIKKNKNYSKTFKESLIKSRIGQGSFRENALKEFNNTCILTGINIPIILEACHIKPWNKSNDEEKLDSNNSLLLSPTFHKLFDEGLISFDNNGMLLVSKNLPNKINQLLNIKEGQKYNLNLNNKRQKYIQFHRINIFKKLN